MRFNVRRLGRTPRAWRSMTPHSSSLQVINTRKKQSKIDRLIEGFNSSTDSTVIGNFLQKCMDTGALDSGREIHRRVVLLGKSGDRFVQNLLIQMYGKCGSVGNARDVFDSVCGKSVFTWNVMLGAYVQNGCYIEAFQLYKRMRLTPNAVTFVPVLEACLNIGSLADLDAVHRRITELSMETNPVVCTALINAFAKCGSLYTAEEVFENIPFKDAACWTSMMKGYVENGDGRGAFNTFQKMNLEGIEMDVVSILTAISACTLLQSFYEGHRLYKNVIRYVPCFYDPEVGCALINMYSKCGRLVEAWKVFDGTYKDDAVLWNSMISAYVENAEYEKAFTLYKEGMRGEFDMKPNRDTFVSLLEACTHARDLKKGTRVHKDVVTEKLDKDPALLNAVINMYGKCGKLDHARKVFDAMCESIPHHVVWNRMMSLYVENDQGKEALELYSSMAIDPDKETYITALAACGLLQDLDTGKKVHDVIVSRGYEGILEIANSLLNMYSRCSCLEDVERVFQSMLTRDVVSFNIMMSALTQGSRFYEAIRMFLLMDLEGIRANDRSFLEVLSACKHTGLLCDTWKYYDCMIDECRIEPSEKHHACIVDTLGYAGKLQEAEDFVVRLESRAGPVLWATLLSSCKLHGDVQRAERAADRAITLDPTDAQPYINLAEIYSDAGMMEEANVLQRRLKEQGRWPGSNKVDE